MPYIFAAGAAVDIVRMKEAILKSRIVRSEKRKVSVARLWKMESRTCTYVLVAEICWGGRRGSLSLFLRYDAIYTLRSPPYQRL